MNLCHSTLDGGSLVRDNNILLVNNVSEKMTVIDVKYFIYVRQGYGASSIIFVSHHIATDQPCLLNCEDTHTEVLKCTALSGIPIMFMALLPSQFCVILSLAVSPVSSS